MKDSKDLKHSDRIAFKKPHPCGSNEWLLLKIDGQLELKCLKCNRKIILGRKEFEKRFKSKLN